MLTKLHTIKISIFLLLILIATAACGGGTTTPVPPPVSVEDAVAMTVAASAGQVPTLSVDEIVALTVAASAPADAGTGKPKDGSDTGAVQPVAPAAPDTTAPDAAAPPVAPPAAVANQPQLRVNQNANVRKGPGVAFDTVTTLQLDTVANVIAKNRDESWYLIDLPGTTNKVWIANSVTDPVFPEVMGSVPVAATIPSPPTSTPTATATATKAATSTATATPTHNAPTHTPMPTHTPTAEYVPIEVEIVVVNDGSIPVCSLYIDLSAGPWTYDLLGGYQLYQGETIGYYFPSGEYDFAAYDCDGNAIMSQFNVLIISGYTWTITGF